MPLIASLFLALQIQAPAVPAIVSDKDYPLRVQVAETGSSGGSFQRVKAWGHGNLLGPTSQGFDFTADCNERFARRPEGDQYFRARWKKPGQRLEILIQQFGSDHITACELKVALQEQAYELDPAGPRMSTMVRPMARPAVPVLEPDPNFPLRVQIWVRSASMSSQYGSQAAGYGNIQGETLTGFDFAHTCPIRMQMGRGGDIYQARWLEGGLRMEILVHEVGMREENVCQMDVGLKSAPYSAPVPGQRGPAAKNVEPAGPGV